ncbi:MAG: tetratricopeptide repeat protein [Bacteroidia bacterium]|nr:tetratricopeptide repeat protein [Bacteroidia bacterium]
MLFFPLSFLAQSADEQLALQAFNNKEYEKAIVYYEKLYDQNSFQFYNNYFKCLLYTKDFKRAEKIAKKQLKNNSTNLSVYIDLADVYLNDGSDKKKADEQYQKAIKEVGADQNQLYNLAQAFTNNKQYDYAIQVYLKGRKIYAGSYPFYYEIADVYLLKGETRNMINEYLDALDFRESEMYMVQTRLGNSLGYDDEKGGFNNPILKAELLKRIQNNPDKTVYSEFLVWIQLQQKDYEGAFIQSKALDKRKKENGFRMMDLGKACMAENVYDVAQKCYQYVIDNNKDYYYDNAFVESANVLYEKITKSVNYTKQDLNDLEGKLQSTIKKFDNGSLTFPVIKKLAHLQAYYLDKDSAAIDLLNKTISFPGIDKLTQAELKLELGDIMILTGDIWEASLLYSQVDKAYHHEPIGQEAKYRVAKVYYYSGDFKLSKAQFDVLKGATSKLISNDAMDMSLVISDAIGVDTNDVPLAWFSSAELLIRQNKFKQAISRMDSIMLMFPDHTLADDILMKKAQIAMKTGKFQEAADFYQKVVTDYGSEIFGDDAQFNIGEIYEKYINDVEKAKTAYQDLMVNYPSSVFTTEARKRFRKLRGDVY